MLKNVSDKVQFLKWDGKVREVNPGQVFDVSVLFDLPPSECAPLEPRFVRKFAGAIALAAAGEQQSKGKAPEKAKEEGDKQEVTKLEDFTQKDLLEMAKSQGIDLPGNTSKAKIIEAINAKLGDE